MFLASKGFDFFQLGVPVLLHKDWEQMENVNSFFQQLAISSHADEKLSETSN